MLVIYWKSLKGKLLKSEVIIMNRELSVQKAERFIARIKAGEIKVDRRPNHGEDFYGAYERRHKEIFHDYLGSCSRYLMNKRLKEQKYHG